MPDSDHTPDPQESNTSQNAQTTSTANTTMLVAMGCILLLGLVAVLLFKDKGKSSEEEIAALKKQIADEKIASGNVSDPLATTAEVEARLKAIRDNANMLQAGFDKLKNDLATTSNALKQAHANNQTQQNLIANYGAQIKDLQSRLAQYSGLAANANAYQQQIQALNSTIAQQKQEIAALLARPSKERLDAAESSLNAANATKDQLAAEIARLKQQMLNMVDATELNQLKQQLSKFRTENEDLRQQIQALRTKIDFAKLFIKSYDQLPAKASALFKELQTLEGKNTEQLKAAYTRIRSTLKADNLRQIKFATGSSLVNFTDQANLRNTLGTTNASDYFLVVGYASKTGDAASNETLSANRATAVASIVNMLKQEGQDVRAVYLGQTDRFSKVKAGDNQLCEIWRIRE